MTATLGAVDRDAFTRVLESRYSVRGFRPGPVSDDVISDLLDAAQRAPSWCNVQPWDVHLLSGDALIALSKVLLEGVVLGENAYDLPAPERYEGVYRDRRRASGFALYESLGIARDDADARRDQARRNFAFFDAPHALIIACPEELMPYALVDCGAYIATFQLAATAAGLGTVAQAAVAQQAPRIRRALGISDNLLIVCGVAFGYADDDHPANGFRTARDSVTQVIHEWRSGELIAEG